MAPDEPHTDIVQGEPWWVMSFFSLVPGAKDSQNTSVGMRSMSHLCLRYLGGTERTGKEKRKVEREHRYGLIVEVLQTICFQSL